ncbi:hypothetical protein [Kangiella sp.]|uniref:hypothetical protein n=1 Tax=Kangiella sp. TaxID=1920245 RepID=UPI0019C9214A|nr:hypothetical protein [Kangiella sp.]MBD3654106.1 hypothetical protein [Kangiella sp.]
MKELALDSLNIISGGNESGLTDSTASERQQFVSDVCDSGSVDSFSIEVTKSVNILGWELNSGDSLTVDCNERTVDVSQGE